MKIIARMIVGVSAISALSFGSLGVTAAVAAAPNSGSPPPICFPTAVEYGCNVS